MHLVPADRAHRHLIDEHQVCQAIAALPEPGEVRDRAQRFDLLSDPTRLSLLLAIRAGGPIAVTDLAVATGLNDPTVSQALRLLRTAGAVTATRDGRTMRYTISDPVLAELLDPPTG